MHNKYLIIYLVYILSLIFYYFMAMISFVFFLRWVPFLLLSFGDFNEAGITLLGLWVVRLYVLTGSFILPS